MTDLIDDDPFSIVIVEDLLHGVNDWRSIKDIVRLTFKAITDIIKSQGLAIRDLEKQIIRKATKQELNTCLAGKANFSEVQKQFNGLLTQLDQRLSIDDLQRVTKDFCLKSDLDYIEQQKCSHEELKILLAKKASINDIKKENDIVEERVDIFSKDVKSQCANMQNDLYKMQNALVEKANLEQVNQMIESKASKQSVQTALENKVSKQDLEIQLERKADQLDITNILATIEHKCEKVELQKFDMQYREFMDSLQTQISQKLDLSSFEQHLYDFKQQIIEEDDRYSQILSRFEEIRQDINSNNLQVNSQLKKKADHQELEKMSYQLQQKAEVVEVTQGQQKLRQEILDLQNRNKSDLQITKKQILDQMNDLQQNNDLRAENLKQDFLDFQEYVKQKQQDLQRDVEQICLKQKKEIVEMSENVNGQLSQLKNDIYQTKNNLTNELIKKVDNSNFQDYKSKLDNQLEDKVDLMEVQNALNAVQADMSKRFIDFKDEVKHVLKEQTDQHDENLKTHLDSVQNNADLMQKVDFQDFNNLKDFVEKVFKDVSGKADLGPTQQFMEQIGSQVRDVQRNLEEKVGSKDMCILLDTKASVEDVNKALNTVQKDIDAKANVDQLNTITADQALLNEQLCSENVVGRWAWKSGEIQVGNQVPWELQIINTLPDNFIWEKDSPFVLIQTPGLYQISCGFFSKKKPQIQILINGEPILSAVNTSSYVVHHTSGKLKDVKHSSGNQITGLTLLDYIIIPSQCRIGIAYSGELGCEGFIGLKRL